jgi:hypothetical protein
MAVLVAVDDARMVRAAVMDSDEIRNVREEDSTLTVGVGKLNRVGCPE